VLQLSDGYAALGGSLASAHENPNEPGTHPETVESYPHVVEDELAWVRQQYVVDPALPGCP
jgi:hypothetical protein